MKKINMINKLFKDMGKIKFEGHTGQIDYILSSLEEHRESLVTGLNGRNAIEIITGIYKTGSERYPIILPIKKNDAFTTVKGIRKKPYIFMKRKNQFLVRIMLPFMLS